MEKTGCLWGRGCKEEQHSFHLKIQKKEVLGSWLLLACQPSISFQLQSTEATGH